MFHELRFTFVINAACRLYPGTEHFIGGYSGCLPVGVDGKLLTKDYIVFGRVKPAVARVVIESHLSEQESAVVCIQIDTEKVGIARASDKLF